MVVEAGYLQHVVEQVQQVVVIHCRRPRRSTSPRQRGLSEVHVVG